MANKHTYGSRSAVIRCPNCGEDYSVTYKRCPFCDEKAQDEKVNERYDDEYENEYDQEWDEDGTARLPRSGGKRLVGRRAPRRGGGGRSILGIAGTVISLALIIGAIWIVATQIIPLVKRGEINSPGTTPPVETLPGTTTPGPTTPGTTPAPDSTPGLVEPSPMIPASQTASSFTLDKSDFTINDSFPDPVKLKVTFAPAGSTGSITWSSSDESVATVNGEGLISPTKKNGSSTITATLAGGYVRECVVRCNFSGGSTPDTNTGSLSLNREDFSLQRAGETFQMKVSGTSSTPTWSIGNTAVATISGDGTVTAVGKGNTTITCTVDGKTLTCIARCSF